MKRPPFVFVGFAAVLAVGGCAETPTGPHVQVLPAPNKPFEVFAQEQAMCKKYASDEVSGQADQANQKALAESLVGAALGAGIGAATGGGHGAGVGAAVGGTAGTVVGAASSDRSRLSIQQQYDNAYSQCMYAKGNQIVSQPAAIHVIQPGYYGPPPVVYTAPPPVVYSQPPQPQGYAAPPGAAAPPPNTAPPATHPQGYAAPPGAAAPPPNMPPPPMN